MPFIKQERRKIIKEKGLDGLKDYPKSWIEPGDRCFVFYKPMVDRWKENPRWTTAHEILKDMVYSKETMSNEDQTAQSLAWQVFFIKYVMPYEDAKEKENGTI